MEIVIKIILALIFTNSLNQAVSDKIPILHEKLIKIIFSCFNDNFGTLVVSPDISEAFHQFLKTDLTSVSLIVIDSDFSPTITHWLPSRTAIILVLDSVKVFNSTIKLLKSSNWWSIDALLIVLTPQGCQDAVEYLNEAWKVELLLSLHLCYDEVENGMKLYTYNPYTNRAPQPWIKIKTLNNRWTLYEQMIADEINCKSLTYDKTKFMDGYPIKTVAFPSHNPSSVDLGVNYKLDSLKNEISKIASLYFFNIFQSCNISATVIYHDLNFFNNRLNSEFQAKMKNNNYDYLLKFRGTNTNPNFIYPLFQDDIVLISQRGSFLRPEDKIANFYSLKVVYMSILVLFITFLAIICERKNQEWILVVLEIFRMSTGTGILQPLNSIAIRIYLFGVFQLVIIILGTFQGNLCAFLTKPARYNIESVKNIEEFNYHVYIPDQRMLKLPENWINLPPENIHVVNSRECVNNVLNDSKSVCVDYFYFHVTAAKKYKLHLPKEIIQQSYIAPYRREGWALMKKLDLTSARLVESGLINYWYAQDTSKIIDKFKFDEEQEVAARYRPIKFDDLRFSFRILLIPGLFIAIVVFMIEIFPKKKFLRFLKKIFH